jgi:hypothetical protein
MALSLAGWKSLVWVSLLLGITIGADASRNFTLTAVGPSFCHTVGQLLDGSLRLGQPELPATFDVDDQGVVNDAGGLKCIVDGGEHNAIKCKFFIKARHMLIVDLDSKISRSEFTVPPQFHNLTGERIDNRPNILHGSI